MSLKAAISLAVLACFRSERGACASEADDVELLQHRIGVAARPTPAHLAYRTALGITSGPLKQGSMQAATEVPSILDGVPVCDLQAPDSSGCKLEDMEVGVPQNVAPGGETACINSSATFVFRVVRGDPKKLLFHFEGGGVCINQATTVIQPACTTGNIPLNETGVFDLSNNDNPYRNWTIVTVRYCSGDFFIGNITQEYEDADGQPVAVRQHGYLNAKAALDWTRGQMPLLKELVVSGSSAGSMGVHFWAREVLKTYKGQVEGGAAMIADSSVQLQLKGILFGGIYVHIGACNLPIFSASFQAACNVGQADATESYLEAMRENPEVIFTAMDSKRDHTQIFFNNLIIMSLGGDTPLGPAEFFHHLNLVLRRLDAEPNFVSHVIDSDVHRVVETPYLYEASVKSPAPCKKNDNVTCPVSGAACAGNECCPQVAGLVDGKTFPCPSAIEGYKKCEHNTKVSDCVVPGPSAVMWIDSLTKQAQELQSLVEVVDAADSSKRVRHRESVKSLCSGELLRESEWSGSHYCDITQAGKELPAAAAPSR